MRTVESAETRVRYGSRRVDVLLRREGWRVNRMRTHRIRCREGLHPGRKRPHSHVSGSRRMPRPEAACPRVSWSMDFVAAVDDRGREGPAIEAGQSTTGAGVAAVNEGGE